jgi:hypothetical protein
LRYWRDQGMVDCMARKIETGLMKRSKAFNNILKSAESRWPISGSYKNPGGHQAEFQALFLYHEID